MNVKNEQRKSLHLNTNKTISLILLVFAIVLLVVSFYYGSQIAAVIGLGLTFWGAILLYITPTKHVPLELLNAIASSTTVNIERALEESKLTEAGIYLPPKQLNDFDSSLVFVPANQSRVLPTNEQTSRMDLYLKNPNGALLTPPGLALSKLFEKELNVLFTKTDFETIKQKLPKLLIEDLEIAEKVEIESEKTQIKVTIKNTVLDQICADTRKMPRVQHSVGNVLSSAMACAFAKSIGKPIIISKDEATNETIVIEFNIVEDQ